MFARGIRTRRRGGLFSEGDRSYKRKSNSSQVDREIITNYKREQSHIHKGDDTLL
jgi:hypothetical protein